MGSLADLSTDEVIAQVLDGDGNGDVNGDGDRTGWVEVAEQLVAANGAAWAATSPRLLELCRVRIAMLLGCDAEVDARTADSGVEADVVAAIRSWPTDLRFDALDRACLAFTEHYVIDVASIDDASVAAVREHLGDQGLVDFVNALLVVEQRIRLRLTWDRLIGGG